MKNHSVLALTRPWLLYLVALFLLPHSKFSLSQKISSYKIVILLFVHVSPLYRQKGLKFQQSLNFSTSRILY